MAVTTTVISYDIRQNRARARVAAVLQAYGDRIQKSVFLVSTTPEDLATVIERCRRLLDESTDSLYVFHQCVGCWEDQLCVGQAMPPTESWHWSAF